jgi:hypothetical protein
MSTTLLYADSVEKSSFNFRGMNFLVSLWYLPNMDEC